ncbi:hypothetical protein [Halorubellus sp. PRR65]|uniref:DUF7519 family protein n=1 Tax=Halorubellus sp. PRR65 TaxID=3098148 RepID=UPI002B25E230|nr:hypothetical protein [Halorubellus sp. PRR65]
MSDGDRTAGSVGGSDAGSMDDVSGGADAGPMGAVAGGSGGRSVTEAVAATAVSGAVVVGTTAVVVAAVGWVLGFLGLAVAGLAAGASLAVASTLCNGESPLWMAAGSVGVVVGVVAAVYALSRPLSDPSVPLTVGPAVFAVGALVAGLGATAAVPGSLGDGQWARTVVQAAATTALPGVVVVVAGVGAVGGGGEAVTAVESAVGEGTTALLAPQGPNANVGGFLGLAGAAALSVAVALRTLPIVNLVARARRGAVARRVGRARSWLVRGGVTALFLAVVVTAWPAAAFHDVLADVGVEGVLAAVVDVPVLRQALAAVALGALAASTVAVGVRRVANVDGRRVLRLAATTTPGGSVLLAVGVLRPELVLSRLRIGPVSEMVDAGADLVGVEALALAVLISLVLGTTLALSALTTAAGVGFIPNRTAAPSVAAGGVLLVAVAAGISEGEYALATFAAVVASMVVWDVGNYGVDVTAELDGTTSRVVEVLHAAGSATVGVILVGVAFVALWASRRLAAGGGIDGPGLLGLALLVVATLGLMSTLRG